MKKIFKFMGLLGIICGACCLFFLYAQRIVQMQVNEEDLYLSIKAGSRTQIVLPWQNEDGIIYYFLPSCTNNRIYFDHTDENILINGRMVNQWTGFLWEPESIYTIEAAGRLQQVVFLRSENIPAIFLSTQSGSMDYLHADKENQETGTIQILTESGNLHYSGNLASISGRGNSTWQEEKKPYSITLEEAHPLCGMDAGASWKLLALYYEHDKIHSRLTYDMAQELGLTSTPECTWIDLYCNGEYLGLYLLTESRKNNLEKDTLWLLEKTQPSKLTAADEAQSFFTGMEYLFHAEYIPDETLTDITGAAEHIQQIEDLIAAGDPAYREYLDLESLAKKFLLEKIVMNYDAMRSSSYFTLNADGRLYAGPAWDYDNTFGTSGFFDYTSPLDRAPLDMTGWFHVLYEDEDFYRHVVDAYTQLLPWLESMLSEGIDAYADEVRSSVSMDLARWGMVPNKMYIYREYANYVRYLKYFLANRLNYLNEQWGVDNMQFEGPRVSETYHTVTLQDESGRILERRQVRDGTCMEDLPELVEALYMGWYFVGVDRQYESYFPIYEDTVLYAREEETDV